MNSHILRLSFIISPYIYNLSLTIRILSSIGAYLHLTYLFLLSQNVAIKNYKKLLNHSFQPIFTIALVINFPSIDFKNIVKTFSTFSFKLDLKSIWSKIEISSYNIKVVVYVNVYLYINIILHQDHYQIS
jgi:hypothetical protein